VRGYVGRKVFNVCTSVEAAPPPYSDGPWHGKKSPIILDDALVFSDDGRFEAMQQILERAAERLQIIVLTCHERAYFGRGWATKRLQDSKIRNRPQTVSRIVA
jgi:wobble nucleotide-excising tRNase